MERDKQRLADASHQIVSHEFEAVTSPLPPATAAAEDFSISMSRINPALRDLTNHSPPVRDSEVRKPGMFGFKQPVCFSAIFVILCVQIS